MSGNVNNFIITRDTSKRRMKETLFTRHRSTVEPMMIAKDRKATLQAIHTKTVNQAVNSQGRNVVLDDRPPLINISEKELTRRDARPSPNLDPDIVCSLSPTRAESVRMLASTLLLFAFRDLWKEWDDSNFQIFSQNCQFHHRRLSVDCAKTPHNVKHLFNCPTHPTTMTPSDLWSRPVDAIRELAISRQ